MAPTLTINTSTSATKVGNALMSVKTPKTAFFDCFEHQINSPSTPLPATGALDYALTITSPTAAIGTDSISFEDFEDLKWRIGEQDAKAIITRFDPRSTLAKGPMLVLKPLHDARDRFMAHNIIDRIYGSALIHEVSRRSNEMHVWVPGSKVPVWLQKLHHHRSKTAIDKSKANVATNNNTAYTKKPFNGNNTKTSVYNKSGGRNGAPALRAPRDAPTGDTMHTGWGSFAVAAPKQYADNVNKYTTESRPKVPTAEHKITETFGPSKPTPTVTKEAKEAAPAPAAERKSALPPHLRKKAAAAEAANAA